LGQRPSVGIYGHGGQELDILEYVEAIPIKWKEKRRFTNTEGNAAVITIEGFEGFVFVKAIFRFR
jgi:hypothetical protein